MGSYKRSWVPPRLNYSYAPYPYHPDEGTSWRGRSRPHPQNLHPSFRHHPYVGNYSGPDSAPHFHDIHDHGPMTSRDANNGDTTSWRGIHSGRKPAFESHSSPKPQSKTLDPQFDTSSHKTTVQWNPISGNKNIRYAIEISDMDGNCWNFVQPWMQTRKEMKTTPGREYTVRVECRDNSKGNTLIAFGEGNFKAQFSNNEQKLLLEKAIKFAGFKMHSFWHLYRCKPKSYFDEIYLNKCGIMEIYIKDNNGQPANKINGQLNGLFFSARLRNNMLPISSPFGDVRMIVEPHRLLHPHYNNYYFADFYCNNITHYVTVVVCAKNSLTDNYCRENLISLNPFDNLFLKTSMAKNYYGHETIEYSVNQGVWVEILYTENVLLDWGTFASITPTGHGTSKIGGLPNNKNCTICNLSPILGTKPVSCMIQSQSTERDEQYENIEDDALDVTVNEENPLNSTMFTIQQQDRDKIALRDEDWEDVVETTCGLVDSVVCEFVPSEDHSISLRNWNPGFLNDSRRRIQSHLDDLEQNVGESTKSETNVKLVLDLLKQMGDELNKSVLTIENINSWITGYAERGIRLKAEQLKSEENSFYLLSEVSNSSG